MVKLNLREKSGGVTIECRISPRAGRSRIKGVREGVLQIALSAPPVEGRANDALIELISKSLGVKRSAVSIAQGMRSKNKVVFIEGMSAPEAIRKLSDTQT